MLVRETSAAQPGEAAASGTYRWIATDAEVAELVDRLVEEPRYAMDTEFHRERTYFPKLALMQIAFAGEIVLIEVSDGEPKTRSEEHTSELQSH